MASKLGSMVTPGLAQGKPVYCLGGVRHKDGGNRIQVGKRYVQLPPPPQYIALKGPYFHSEAGLGIKSIALYEFDASKIQCASSCNNTDFPDPLVHF